MTSYKRQNVRSVYETCQYSSFASSNGKSDKGVHKVMYTEYAYIKITLFKTSCNAQWPVVGLRKRHLKRPSGTRARLRFHSNRRWLKTKDFCKGFVKIFSPTLQSHDI